MANKGGRGKKALYETTHSRIPENIKEIVDSISNSYKEYVEKTGCLDFDDKNLFPSIPAIYLVFNEDEILYIGQTKNLANRWKSHNLLSSIKDINNEQSVKIAWINYHDTKLLTGLEELLIENLQPRLNLVVSKNENLKFYQPKWKSGKTKTIRVPVAIAEQVLEIAHQIDEGNFQTIDKNQVKKVLSDSLSVKSNRGGEIKDHLVKLGALLGYKIERPKNRKPIVTDMNTEP